MQRHRLVPGLFVMLATVSGCGDGSSGGSGSPADSPLVHQATDVDTLPLPAELARVLKPWRGDLDEMIERRLLRVAVTRSGFFYYIRGGRQYGLTADAIALLEKFVNARFGLRGANRVQVVAVPLTRDRLLAALQEGQSDIAAGGLTITEPRRRLVRFTDPWVTDVREVVVTGPLARRVETLADLSGREVVVRASSSYHESLRKLSQQLEDRGLEPIVIVPAHEVLEAEDLFEMASVGMIGITVADDHIADFWARVFDELTVRHDLVIRDDGAIAWAVRDDSPQLQAMLNEFVEANRPGTLTGNVIVNRYIDNPRRVSNALAGDRLNKLAVETPYFRAVAKQYGFHWLQLAAQGYQESRLNNRAISEAGAVGIMQVLPSTARAMGVTDFRSPEGNIRAGAKYMRHIIDDYLAKSEIDPMNQWLLALASYNAGATRIARLRRHAADNGLDPNVWFDEVERQVQKEVGPETVRYVRNVMKYYLAYRMTLERERLRQDVRMRLERQR